MKNFIHFFKAPLFLFAMLFTATISIAQTVTVPANCRVITTNTLIGGVLGFGGKVTDGGVVAMPDLLLVSPFTPNQGGTFTFTPPVVVPAVTTASWSLKGDLSNTLVSNTVNGVTGNFNGATNPSNGLSATILSYNRRFRTSEGVAPSNQNWARSNGQVRVTWTSCGGSLTFNVYKNFNSTITTIVAPIVPVAAVPIIVGPDCLKPNTQYTYSVDQIVSDNTDDAIGFDSYYWSGLPPALANATTTYTSADRSSITFTTGSTVSTFTLQCCYGRVNPNTADGGPFTSINQTVTPTRTTCVSKSLLIAPVAPSYSPGFAPPICVAVGAPAPAATVAFSIVYPNVPTGQTYTWTAPNTGWAGLTTPAVNTPAGFTTLTVNTSYNNNPGLLTLTITGNGCDPAIFNYQINRSLAATTTITPVSPSTTCIGGGTILVPTNNTYTINANAVGVTLAWSTIPAAIPGITLTPSTNTNSVTVKAAGAAAGSFTLQAKGTAPCSTPVVSTTIDVQPAAPAFTPGTPSCVVRSATGITTVAVTPITGATSYDWTPLPAGVTISGANNIANPTFVFNSAVGVNSVTLTVKAIGTNSCAGSTTSKVINYITVATNFSGGTFNDQYAVSGTCGPVTSWTLSTGVAPNIVSTTYTATTGNINITGANNNNLQVSGTTGLALTAVCANLASGITVCANLTGATNTQKQSNTASNSDIKEENKNVTITPNPNSGTFTITVAGFDESASATLTDFSGNEIQTYILRIGDNKIEKEGLPKGTYFIILKIDGKRETKQVIVK